MVFLRKGSLWLSFCLTLSFCSKGHGANLDAIANDARWHALLHLVNGQPQITSDFLLSADHFSPVNELNATIQLFRSNNENRCRFLARHYFLTQISGLHLPAPYCPGFTQFKRAVPVERLSLIYASENLLQPASIMGHTMLAMENQNQTTQHAFSFFTELNDYNPVNLVWDNLIKGQPGFITVQPLQSSLKPYKDEQRNVWVYELNLNSLQKELIQRHIWALKSASLTYLFNSHNCATLILDTLSVAAPDLQKHRQKWVSPIDVAKAIRYESLIKETHLHGSSEWKVRSLSQVTDPFSQSAPASKPLAIMLSNEINDHQYRYGYIGLDQWQSEQSRLRQIADVSGLTLTLDTSKGPLETPADSQWGISMVNDLFNKALLLEWMPASHHLIDDNRYYASENALEILNITLAASGERLELYDARLYQVTSYLRHNPHIGGWSGEFGVGLTKIEEQNNRLMAYLSGGLGKTIALHKDIDAFALWTLGSQVNRDVINFAHGPKIGAIMRLIGPSKLVVSHQYTWQSQFVNQQKTLAQMAWYLSKGINIDLVYQRKEWEASNVSETISAGVRFLY